MDINEKTLKIFKGFINNLIIVFPEHKDVQLLIAFCREMQREFGDFFLSCADCSRLLRMPQTTVWRWLGRIEGLGIIRCLKKGKRGMSGKASTYRYLYPLDDGREEESPQSIVLKSRKNRE